MPYAKPRLTRPLPRPAVRRVPWRAAKPQPAGQVPFSQLLGTWNFDVRVYVAWDSATTANPSWIDVSEFVDISAGIKITRGRPDGESNPQVGTCTLTVDDSDGRWSPANPNGAWFGQIRKGAWLRVDVLPPSGTVSTRFVGFIQSLPVTWGGKTAYTQIAASDRFALLGNAPKYQSAIVEEWLNDPIGSQYIVGYWPLHEPAAASYASDVSGMSPPSQSALSIVNHGVNPGAGITFANTGAPGYDGISTVTFTPSGTAINGTGSLTNGSYLQGSVGPNGNVAQISIWVNTTIANQPFLSWEDPASNYVFGLGLGGDGYLNFFQAPLSGTSTLIGTFFNLDVGRCPINDGSWHLVSVKMQTSAAISANSAFFSIAIDGIDVYNIFTGNNQAANIVPPSTLSRLTVGAADSWQAWNSYNGVCMFSGSLSDLVVHALPSSTLNVNWYGPYVAGTTMWQSPGATYSTPESCGRRVVRLAACAGVPTPSITFTLPSTLITASDITVGVTPFLNIPAETAHPAGMQQIQGQQAVASMQAVAATENMPLFVDRQGRITLQPSTLRQNPTAAFSINALDLDPSTQWADDFQYLQNQTVVTPSGQGSLTVNTNGLASQALSGLYSGSISSVTVNALESGSLGAAVNYAGAAPAPRHNPLACEVATLARQAFTVAVPAAIATSAAGWALNFVQTAAAFYGTQAYQSVIPAGAAASQDDLDITIAATATTIYAFQASVAVPAGTQGGSFRVAINWLNASSGIISQSFGTITAIPAGSSALTQLTVSGTAPAGTVTATLRLELMTAAGAGLTVEASGLQWQTGTATAWQIPGGSSPNLLTVDQATAGQGTPYTGAPAYGPAWYDLILAADISTCLGVIGWPSQSPGGSTGSYYIEGYTETISAGNHLFAWNTSPAQGPTYQCDSPTLGLIDTPGITLAY